VASLRRLEHQDVAARGHRRALREERGQALRRGRIEYRQWQDKDGQTRYSTEINVRELIMLTSKSQSGAAAGDFDGAGEGSGSYQRRSRQPAAAAERSKASAGGEEFEDFPGALADEDDDLPF
jgi:single-strand DNA-binding protein